MAHLYLAENKMAGEFKIGRSINPVNRVKQIPNFTLVDSFFVGTYENSVDAERWMLRTLKRYCVRGNEWFVFPKSVNALKTFRMLCAKQMRMLGVDKVEDEARYLKHLSEEIDGIKDRLRKRKTIPQYVYKRALNNITWLVEECGYNESQFKDEHDTLLKAIEKVTPDDREKDLTIPSDKRFAGLHGLHVTMKGLYHKELERLKSSANDTTRCDRWLAAYRKALEVKCAYPAHYFKEDDEWLEEQLMMLNI